MASQCNDPECLVWALIDVSGGVKTRGVLQDAFFLGQELGLISSRTFEFPVWPGIGTARYSDELDDALTSAIQSGRVYDTGGPATLKAIQSAPDSARSLVAALGDAIQSIDESSLSLIAAYVMAKHSEKKDGVKGEVELRKAAKARLGWPSTTIREIEKRLTKLRVK